MALQYPLRCIDQEIFSMLVVALNSEHKPRDVRCPASWGDFGSGERVVCGWHDGGGCRLKRRLGSASMTAGLWGDELITECKAAIVTSLLQL
ncbi:hypothetical protein LIA77_02403 [Sarocladium implicatum]|nr:hypothetical protein LIA77_02403 [Sarocladium implicatum]